jgi:hypothetical protein
MKTGPDYRYRLVRTPLRHKGISNLFDGTLQKTNVWLSDIMKELDWQNRPEKAITLYAPCFTLCGIV